MFNTYNYIWANATFKGTNGSMGFQTNHEYRLAICVKDNHIWIKSGIKECPYSTMKALLKNWNFN